MSRCSGHYVSTERLLEINKLPKVAILSGDSDTIIDPQRSHDLASFMPVGDIQTHSRLLLTVEGQAAELVVYEGGGQCVD